MTTEKKPRHKHDFKFVSWKDVEPSRQDDAEYFHRFSVNCQCECGIKKVRDATLTEVEDYIKSLTCQHCDTFNVRHQNQADCIRHLNQRLKDLEDKLENLGDKFDKVANVFRNAKSQYDYY